MANEFVVKNGLIVSGSTTVSGSVTAFEFTGNFTGSLEGTASYAIQALTASYAENASGTGFPFTGSAEITGSLVVTGSVYNTQGIANPSLLADPFTTTEGFNYALVGPVSGSNTITIVTGSVLKII
jgi:hypothetical protein